MSTKLSPQEYFELIRPLRNPDEIKALCDRLTSELFNETDKPKTRVNKLTPYSKPIKSIPNEELIEGENAYIQVKADGILWKRHLHFQFTGIADTNFNGETVINEDGSKTFEPGINTSAKILGRLENRKEIEVSKYIEVAQKLLNSDDPHELAVGLIAVSGRRQIEILLRGKFTLVSEYQVNFIGQAKKRDYDSQEKLSYQIGVLVPAKAFIQQFKRFRAMPETKELFEHLKDQSLKGISDEEINKSIDSKRGQSLRRVVAREFIDCLPIREGDENLNPKALRAAYLRMICDRDCPKTISPALFASRAVGHFTDREFVSDEELRHLTATLSYEDYYCDSEVPFVKNISIKKTMKKSNEKTMNVKIYESDMQKVKALQEKWDLHNQQEAIHTLISMADKVAELEKKLLDAENEISNLQNSQQENTVNQSSQSRENELENIDFEKLKTKRGKDAVDEKIRRAYLAIINHNDYKATENQSRYAINNQALRQLSGCNGIAVTDWMKRHAVGIDDHNAKYGLGAYSNKGKNDITTVISVE